MQSTFASLVAMYIFCASGAPVIDGKCDGAPANVIEMRVLGGSGLCPDWNCADDVSYLFEITQDGKVLVSVPANAVSRDVIDKLWIALKPVWRQ